LLEHQGSASCEQLGGFYRANEEFNGVGAVVSYLNNKGGNHKTYDNRMPDTAPGAANALQYISNPTNLVTCAMEQAFTSAKSRHDIGALVCVPKT
jgi:hypothetical protein